jgi:hypothetical protein
MIEHRGAMDPLGLGVPACPGSTGALLPRLNGSHAPKYPIDTIESYTLVLSGSTGARHELVARSTAAIRVSRKPNLGGSIPAFVPSSSIEPGSARKVHPALRGRNSGVLGCGLGTEAVPVLSAQREVVAEVVDQGTPERRCNMVGAGNNHALIGVDPDNVRLDDEELAGGIHMGRRSPSLEL